jgi:hypothetical protein
LCDWGQDGALACDASDVTEGEGAGVNATGADDPEEGGGGWVIGI